MLRKSIGIPRHRHNNRPDGFTVLGAVAELERSLIAERVRAGLRNTRAKGPPKVGTPVGLPSCALRVSRGVKQRLS